jgi:hypothetical protein
MRRLLFLLPVLLPVAAPSGAVPAVSGSLVCALVDVYDCSESACTETTSEAVGVPDLIRVDRDKKVVVALDPEFGGASSPIESEKREGANTTVRVHDGDRTLVLVADDQSGDATLTVTGLKLTIVAYGECTP